VETKPAPVYPIDMEKPEAGKRKPADRRQDHAMRLKIAVRRAHDPLFTRLAASPASIDDVVDRRLLRRPPT
jgi:hypothetical protein